MFEKTKAALTEYDAGKAERDKDWNNVNSIADIRRVEAADKAAADKVHEAFYEDTKDARACANTTATSAACR